MVKRVSSLGILLFISLMGIIYKDNFLIVIKEGGSFSIFISMLLVAICVFVPILPFPVLAGIIGAVFGTIEGMFISFVGAMAGTLIFFLLCRYGFKEFAQEKLRTHPKIREYEDLLNRKSFLAILTCRLIPIIPAPVVNIVCGLSKVKWVTFFIASAMGKLPNIIILSYAGASFASNKFRSIGLYGLYILIIFLIYLIFFRNPPKKTSN